MKTSEFRKLIREEVRKVMSEARGNGPAPVKKNATYRDILTNPKLLTGQVFGPTALSKAGDPYSSDRDYIYKTSKWKQFEKEWLAKTVPVIKALQASPDKVVPEMLIHQINVAALDDQSLFGYPKNAPETEPEMAIFIAQKNWKPQLAILKQLK